MDNLPKCSASEVPVHEVLVWYSLPFSAEEKPANMGKWKVKEQAASDDQLNYFHPFVSEALFSERDVRNGPRIQHYTRPDLVFDAQESKSDTARSPLIVDMQADRVTDTDQPQAVEYTKPSGQNPA